VFANATNANNIVTFEIELIVFMFSLFKYSSNIEVLLQTCCKTYVIEVLSFC